MANAIKPIRRLVTGNDAAAKRDVLTAIVERFPPARILVAETYVQGPRASAAIVEALHGLCEAGADVIVLARGGGSFEPALLERKLWRRTGVHRDGLTHRARAGSAAPSLLTWLPRGQWLDADRNRGRGFRPRTESLACQAWRPVQLPAKSKPYLAPSV